MRLDLVQPNLAIRHLTVSGGARTMAGNRRSRTILPTSAGALVLVVLLVVAVSSSPILSAQNSPNPPAAASPAGEAAPASARPVLPRGKKLMLTDGTFQLVREYKIEGDRVKYYSMDSSQWEQIPSAMVDWDATKKVEA